MTVKHGLGWTEGTEAEKVTMPAGHYWIATDSGILYRSNGTSYDALYPSIVGDGVGRVDVWDLFEPGGSASWTNMPAALTVFRGTATDSSQKVDFTNLTKFKLTIETVSVAPVNGAKLGLQYSLDGGSTWKGLDNGTAGVMSDTAITMTNTLGRFASAVGTINSEARIDDILVRVVGSGGNGSTDPQFRNFFITFYKDILDSFTFPFPGTSTSTHTNAPAAVTIWGTDHTTQVDLTNVDRFRIFMGIDANGTATTVLGIQYSADNGVTWKALDSDVTDAMSSLYISLAATGYKYSGVGAITSNARTTVLIRLVSSGGDGVADPRIKGGAVIFYKEGTTQKNHVCQLLPMSGTQTWANMPAALTEFSGNDDFRQAVDLTDMKYFRLMTMANNLNTLATAKFGVQYSVDGGTTWASLDSNIVDVISTANVTHTANTTAYMAPVGLIAPQAKRECLVRVVGQDGNGAADPSWNGIKLIFYK